MLRKLILHNNSAKRLLKNSKKKNLLKKIRERLFFSFEKKTVHFSEYILMFPEFSYNFEIVFWFFLRL